MTDTEPGVIEIDRSGPEPVVSIGHPPGPYTIDQLRSYASYLTDLAEQAGRRPEPEVDELVAVLDATQARWMHWESAAVEIARAVLTAGYKRDRECKSATRAGPSPIGVRLRQERERLGWTLRETENRTGVPNAHISQIETGAIQRPELATLAPLAAAYGLIPGLVLRLEVAQEVPEPAGRLADTARERTGYRVGHTGVLDGQQHPHDGEH